MSEVTARFAPGWPGIPPRWTSSAKEGVGTALNVASRVWFTLSHGIFNEIYYPRLDLACTRDMGLIVTNGEDFFSEEKRHTLHKVEYLEPGAPAYHLENTDVQGRYCIEKDILSDPRREVVLQATRFWPLEGELSNYHVYVVLAPHLGRRGTANTAWVGHYKGLPMLFAQHSGYALALASSVPWLKRSVGFVGFSDGWQDLNQHFRMDWVYPRAENGNVALTGEINLQAAEGSFLLALGFGRNAAEAGLRARASLLEGFEDARRIYLAEWRDWQARLVDPGDGGGKAAGDEAGHAGQGLYRTSTMVLRTHESASFPGGIIASLSIPWGFARGDNDLGGYHLVWSRDLAEAAGGLLAAGAVEDVDRVLHYLSTTQEADGFWSQNMWLDGTPYWTGIQMDEAAFPILLVDLARRDGQLSEVELARLWPMVRNAAGFVVRNGPVTQEDRWEEDPGYSPFTLAVEVAGLLAAAELAELLGKEEIAVVLRETADAWNANIERWTYVTGSPLAQEFGVEGYYVRIAPPEAAEAVDLSQGYVPIKNRPPGQSDQLAAHIISPDALALVRFGLRAPDDPRILNTIKVIDALLKVETPNGPSWHRYNLDGYGEHADGAPFDGVGIGRAWPLLTGERAHYELAAGNRDAAVSLLRAMEAFANPGGMIPEQVWDAPDIAEKELFCGQPSGSAMPLVWAHAEYVKLRRSLREGQVYDLPPQTVQRYQVQHRSAQHTLWRFNNKPVSMAQGTVLRIETLTPARVHWSLDGWKSVEDTPTSDSGLGIHFVDLPTRALSPGSAAVFTFYWPGTEKWEGRDFTVTVAVQ